jgi:putative ABC transport system permease protein
MVSLARQNLVHEWRRFAAAILTLSFSGLLILVQVGLLLGQLDAFTLPVTRSKADLWITAANIRSWDQSTVVPARTEGLFWSHPAVREVREMALGYTDWRTGDGARQTVMIVGIDIQPGALNGLEGFTAETLAVLSRPDTVVVDQADAPKLGATIGGTAEIAGKRVAIGGFVRGFRSNLMPLVFTSTGSLRQINADWSGNGPPYFLLKLDPRFDVQQVRRELEAADGAQTYGVETPEDLTMMSALFWLEESGAGASFGFSMLLALLVGIGVTGQTLRGAVIASLKEYAALRALGVTVGQLRTIVLEQSLWVALAGNLLMFVIAALLGGLAWVLGIPLVLTWWLGGLTTLFVTVIACLSGLVALSVLYRSEPADLLR